MKDNKISQISKGICDYVDYKICDNTIIAQQHSISKPDEIYKISINGGEGEEISFVNKDLLSQLKMGRVEERRILTTDNKQMLTWVIYPPDFDSTKNIRLFYIVLADLKAW